ncbi:MAG: M28 family peptidase [Candidatus Abyssobacteria bacterium SURF_17]|uniref:M28 family peptidase n=1 Tax=Candidatus Abyssobacteria bacterium SURF_17 TaxID=2093361 RepID=A0A419F379_9BACT|nr:MAG: M28 family peptidase [Candidatus Abyssubacteria bacterium SURF_17]
MPVRTYIEGLCQWSHRGSTTENERQAAEYLREQTSALGLEARLEHFVSHTSFSWVYLIIYGGFFVAGWLGWSHSFWGSILCLLMLAFLYGECTSKWKAVANVLPKRPSQNVLGILRNENARKRIVFVAHYDSSKSGLSFHPSIVGSFRSSFITSIVMALILTQVLIIRYFGGTGGLLSFLRFVATAYMLLPIVLLLHRELFGHYVQGAADNASGVGAMLGVAEKLVKEPPKTFEAWFLATGCEEVNLMGMVAFMRAHQYELSPGTTYFLNFDNLGKGSLRFITAEGMLRMYSSSPEMVCIAEGLATEKHYADVRPCEYRRATLDALVASSRGYKVLSLMALDEADNIAHWHWPTDTIENVDVSLTERASEFALDITRSLDK